MPPRQGPEGRSSAPNFEFWGPYVGPIGISLGLPVVCYFLVAICNGGGCLQLSPRLWVPGLPTGKLFTWQALGVYLGWIAFQVALHLALPGKRMQGVELRDGSRLTYKLTGELNFWITLVAVAVFGFWFRVVDLGWAYDNYVALMSAAIVVSWALSLALFASAALRGDRVLAAVGGSTGSTVYDWFVGRELNPRIGGLDVKEFCELYPGLIGWFVLDLCMAAKQLEASGRVSAAMALICAFHGIYVWDSHRNEASILTTMDITSDGFGFMLAFGDLAWVPFTYSLQARLAVSWPHALPLAGAAACVVLKALGYAVFRGSNGVKDAFRRDPGAPRVRHLRTLQTQRGTRLIVSGWWGLSRHPNYLGDWIMGVAWCLPLGFSSIVPYFYAIYFATLLVHRAMRDDHACRIKYGADWAKYCRLVPARIIPYVY